MSRGINGRRAVAFTLALAVAAAVAACGSPEPEAPPAPAASTTAAPAAPPAPVTTEQVSSKNWSSEALEDLLAPIALYPDPVLSQVLIAATNPQEVLDAGNWLIANEALEGKALDDAAARVGFTPPIRALIQFPQTVDMMCMEMGWTTELGEAFVADQAGVLDAVQRLRRQAIDVGNLKSSEAMTVATEKQEGEEVVVLKPPKPDVVYVPSYDPQAAYAPVPAATATTAPATTTAATTTEDDGHSTGALITTGLLAFGAGILVNEVFDDDDDYYYPNYGYGGMPYYPPYPYRPVYGGGYYPSNGYQRPPNYNSGWQNNGTIIINNPGGGGNGYWDRYDTAPRARGAQPRAVSSPITQARTSRPELSELNRREPRPMPASVQRPSTTTTASNWKGQSTYAGKTSRPAGATRDPSARIAEATPGYTRTPSTSRPGAKDAARPTPKVQGSYAGRETARPPQKSSDAPRPKPTTREIARPPGGGDRGYGATDRERPTPVTSPEPRDRPRPAPQAQPERGTQRDTALAGANRGSADRAASQRGRQSLPQGAGSKGARAGARNQGR